MDWDQEQCPNCGTVLGEYETAKAPF